MKLLEATMLLSPEKRSTLWYNESIKNDIFLEMDNGYVKANSAIFYDSDFEEMMLEFNINWQYDANSKTITMVEGDVTYVVDFVTIENRFNGSDSAEEDIVILDTLRLKK